MKTIFDTFEQLPVKIFMTVIADKGKGNVFVGDILNIIPNTVEFLRNNTDIDTNILSKDKEILQDRSLLVHEESSNLNYIFSNFIGTIICVISNEFITSYINGFEIITQSNN